jgi:hypothetical protein
VGRGILRAPAELERDLESPGLSPRRIPLRSQQLELLLAALGVNGLWGVQEDHKSVIEDVAAVHEHPEALAVLFGERLYCGDALVYSALHVPSLLVVIMILVSTGPWWWRPRPRHGANSLEPGLRGFQSSGGRDGLKDLHLFAVLVFDHMADVVIAAIAAAWDPTL